MFDFLNYEFSTLTLFLAIVVGIIVLFELLHYIIIYGKIVFYKPKNSSTDNNFQPKGVSVVVVVNNNLQALQEDFIMILEQAYPLFEIVVVNENSKDDSEYVLHVLQNNYPNMKVINLEQNANKFSDRKFSLSIGIRSAKYDTIILTDVTCKIKDFNWLSSLSLPFVDSDKKILIGYSAMEYKKGIANSLARYYHLNWAMNFLGYGLIGLPFSADSNNMAYNKKFFFEQGGFISQYTKKCRQEDYFLSRYANKKNTLINLSPSSFVNTLGIESYSDFKRIAYSKYISHRTFSLLTKLRLALMPLATLFLYLLLIGLVVLGMPWQFVLVPLVVKWVVQIIYYNKCSKKLKTKIPYLISPLLEVYFLFFNFNLRLKKLFFRKKEYKIKWKN
ncbi:MAG: glycosyltransferase [Bacteroidota bacterium]|nr:glycosyltransferase [Bacteroidota bacterium]